MTHINKKLVHSYVKRFFEELYPNILNEVHVREHWVIIVRNEIAQFYINNEFDKSDIACNSKIGKLLNYIQIDPYHVKKFKQWQETYALNQIKKDF